MSACGIDTLATQGSLRVVATLAWDFAVYVDTCRACDGEGFLACRTGGEICSVCCGDGLAAECVDCEGRGDAGGTDSIGRCLPCDTCDGLGQTS
nr:hypothetical protein [Kibdelosporangium sp. MJ126-NF4]CEL16274.1 hypothetical protein [Kibdelosporangium sp. MJ126-NF4]CTQ94198.1 hypothetical protein [Kibdelosporangium sp. MJ126-NF4]